MTGGCSLAMAFSQEDACATRSTQAKQDDQAAGLKRKKGYDVKGNQSVDIEKMRHATIGNTVKYTKGEGIIISKSGQYVTLWNEEAQVQDVVHVGETYIPGDTISMGVMNQLWDQMDREVRTALLHKAQITPTNFIDRTWHSLPKELKEVLKRGKWGAGYSRYSGTRGRKDSTGSEARTFNPGGGAGKDPLDRVIDAQSNPGASTTPGAQRSGGSGVGSLAGGGSSRNRRSEPGKKPYRAQDNRNEADTPAKNEYRDVSVPAAARAAKKGWTAEDIYALRNELNKVLSSKPEGLGFGKISGIGGDGPKATPDKDTKVLPDQVRTKKPKKDGYAGQKQDQAGAGMTIGDRVADKSDVEHGAYGGVVTDTPFDAEGDYEEDKREGDRKQLRHEYQKPEGPSNIKEDSHEIRIGYVGVQKGKDKKIENQDERTIINKYNTRYGPRQATQEEIDKYLNK